MSKVVKAVGRRIPEIMLALSIIYVFFAFLSPIAFYAGYNNLGQNIQSVYRVFCHQRVERSLFLFGEKPFYSLEELREKDVIPGRNPYYSGEMSYNIFGYPYWGNEQVGYKVAFCIRDVALYGAYAIAGLILVIWMRKIRKVKKFPVWLIILLVAPLIIDGVFQSFVEYGFIGGIPDVYVENIAKRILTGIPFGIGFAMFVYPNLVEATKEVYGEG